MRVAAFNHGKYGDLLISWPTFCAIKKYYPEIEMVMMINKDYGAIQPLFEHQPEIVDFFITDEYQNFPSEMDKQMATILKLDRMFNPMQPHRDEQWFLSRHQTQEVAHMHGLDQLVPLLDRQIHLNRWFDVPDNSKYICLAPFGNWPHIPNHKSLSIFRAQEIVDFIDKLGLETIQLGNPDEPKLEKTLKKPLTFFENTRNMLGSKLLVTIDSGINWISSAYSHKTLGLYSNSYYTRKYVSAIQPLNQNSIYLDDNNVNDIDIELIKGAILQLIK